MKIHLANELRPFEIINSSGLQHFDSLCTTALCGFCSRARLGGCLLTIFIKLYETVAMTVSGLGLTGGADEE